MEKIKLISHRGNLNGKDSSIENLPSQIDYCIKHGFDVEIDIRYINNNYYLGHDNPQYNIDIGWLLERAPYLWIHCKNIPALESLYQYEKLNYFWHQEDDCTLTSKKFIWTYPNKPLENKSIALLPETWINNIIDIKNLKCYGICSDEIKKIGALLDENSSIDSRAN